MNTLNNTYLLTYLLTISVVKCIHNKLKSKGVLASSVATYDLSTLYATLPHNLFKEKLTELIEQTFDREGAHFILLVMRNAHFFTSVQPKRFKL